MFPVIGINTNNTAMLRLTMSRSLKGIKAGRYSYPSSATRSFSTPNFIYQELFDLAPDTTTQYKKLEGSESLVSEIDAGGMKFLKVEPDALRMLAAQAMTGNTTQHTSKQ